jgi:hypothetical protein
VNVIPCAQSHIIHQRTNIAYLVGPKLKASQLGQVGQRRDIAYLVPAKVEVCQAGEIRQVRDIAYLVTIKAEGGKGCDPERLKGRGNLFP